ncbi:two component transcriptional regulator, LuxR family [Blastococcus fimeti]|nr:two component transcriptional regulator, LuxR family [Blastococcus fimeti]
MSRILLCDDHEVFTGALAMALQARGQDVVSVARSVPEALSEAARTLPDVVLMDLHFAQGPDGLAGIRALVAEVSPAPKMVLLTGSVDRRTLTDAVAAGADGVVSKTEPLHVLLEAVERVAAGAFYADPELLRGSLRPPSAELDQVQLSAQFLTPREREVLGRLVQGSSTGELAQAMGVGVATVRTHVQSVLSKLGVRSRLEAVSLAVAHGLFDPPQRRVPEQPENRHPVLRRGSA